MMSSSRARPPITGWNRLSSSVVQETISLTPRRKLLWWLPTLLWLCLQAAFSTDTFSAEHTGSVLWAIVHALYPGISAGQFAALHFFVRKAAHFTTYGLLSVFAFYSWKAMLPASERWRFRWSALALTLTLVAASLDEFHQSFVPSRGPSPRDVLLDMIGAVFFQMVLAAFLRRGNNDHSDVHAGSEA
jgi:VanZ family protein